MMIFGIELHKPTLQSLTGACLVGVLLWVVIVFAGVGSMTSNEAGAILVAIMFGCVSNSIGIDVTKGFKPLLLNVVGSTSVLLTYHYICGLLE